MTPASPTPSISIIIPAWNAEQYLGAAIESALAQSLPPLEVIVVVDARSTDRTLQLVHDFGSSVRSVVASLPGLGFARNLGNAAARGSFINHLDADDVLLPDAMEKLHSCLASSPTHHMASGCFQCFASPELAMDVVERYSIPANPQRGHLPGVALVRKEVFAHYGDFDENYVVNSDLEWWIRARDSGASVLELPDVVMRRRIHGRNMSILHEGLLKKTRLQIVAASLKRRRQAEDHVTERSAGSPSKGT